MSRILIVDDDKSITSLLKKLLELEPEGFQVEIASRGQQAVEQVNANPPDLIMVDRQLHDMDGIQLVAQIRKQYQDLPIVVASGMNVEKEALQAGADHFILKPFEPGSLPALFMELMDHYSGA
jgi:DNA-binding response OmpR family regulator